MLSGRCTQRPYTLTTRRSKLKNLFFYITKDDSPKQTFMLNLFQHLSAVIVIILARGGILKQVQDDL